MLNLKKQILNYKIKKIIKEYPYILFIQFNNVTPKKWRLIKHQLSKLGIMKTLRVKNQVARKLLKNVDYKKNLTVDTNSTVTAKQSGNSIFFDSSSPKICEKKENPITNLTPHPEGAELPTFGWLPKRQGYQPKTNLVCSVFTSGKPSVDHQSMNTLSLSTKTKEKQLFINEIFQGPTLMLGCSIVEQLPGIYTILEQNSNLVFIGGLFENQVITHLDFKKIIQLDKSVFINLIQQCSSPVDSIFFIKSLMDLSYFTSVQKSLLQTLNCHKEVLKLPNYLK